MSSVAQDEGLLKFSKLVISWCDLVFGFEYVVVEMIRSRPDVTVVLSPSGRADASD